MGSLLKNKTMLFSSNIVKTLLYSPSICSTRVVTFSSIGDAAATRLGLPPKPKKPLSTYMRFFLETHPTLKSSTIKMQDRAAKIGTLWKQLDEQKKQKYQKAYEEEKEQYLKKLKIYDSQVTNKQKLILQHEAIKVKEEKTLRSYYREKKEEQKRRLQESGKPKQPESPFLLFCSAERAKSKDKLKIVDLTKKWNSLTEEEKKPYRIQSTASWNAYKVSLENWKKNALKNSPQELL